MSTKKRGLGRGLDALLGSQTPQAEGGEELQDLPLEALQPNPAQPRRHFDEEALAALADSIRAQGVVQPIVARPTADGGYQIVAGERRWRAAGLAGLKRIPALVRRLDERAVMAVALVENIQRADLNALEEAEALARLIDDCGLTHERAAEAVGKSRAAVTNLLRLLELADEIKALIRGGKLSFGHARALLAAPGDRRAELAQRVAALGLSVRQTEMLARQAPSGSAKAAAEPPDPQVKQLQSELSRLFQARVSIRPAASGGGQVVIAYREFAELKELLARLR